MSGVEWLATLLVFAGTVAGHLVWYRVGLDRGRRRATPTTPTPTEIVRVVGHSAAPTALFHDASDAPGIVAATRQKAVEAALEQARQHVVVDKQVDLIAGRLTYVAELRVQTGWRDE